MMIFKFFPENSDMVIVSESNHLENPQIAGFVPPLFRIFDGPEQPLNRAKQIDQRILVLVPYSV